MNTDIIGCEAAGTIPGLMLHRAGRTPDAVGFSEFDAGGWRDVTWREMTRTVARYRAALDRAGMARGDRVAILLPNCIDWIAFDIAAMANGLITVPLYLHDSARNIRFILSNSGTRLCLIDGTDRWQALALELENGTGLSEVWLRSGGKAPPTVGGIEIHDLAEVLRAHVRRVAQTQTEVLVTGAPGTGVSKVAEVIHLSSALSKGPFVKRASSGLDRAGLSAALEVARNGSLFIDEIAALPADSQIALIEALDGRGTTRVIAGSTADLTQASNLGQINADLFYRFQVMTVRIPSLAERPEDIPILFRHYVAQASEQAGLTAPDITPQVIAALLAQDWPGNARALMSAAMRFALGFREELAPTASNDLGLNDQMSQIEHSLLVAALQRAGGQASVAAQDLKLPRKTFYDKLAKHGIRAEAFRNA